MTETYADLFNNYPGLTFVRTTRNVKNPAKIEKYMVVEEDTFLPLIEEYSHVVPINEKAYPEIFKMASATQAGMYALSICEKNGWQASTPMIYEILKNIEQNLVNEKKDKRAEK